jgi:hypothetical protein
MLSQYLKFLRSLFCVLVVLEARADAGIRVFYPASGGCEAIFDAYGKESNSHPTRNIRGASDFKSEVIQSEAYVHDYYRRLMESGKYELFNAKAFSEFIAEDKVLPRDRTVFVEYRNPQTGEIEGVMRAFFGFAATENWRLYGVGKAGRGRGMFPTSNDNRLPMEYNQFKPAAGFFKPMKVEFGRLVTREGADRGRIAIELVSALLDTVFLPSLGATGRNIQTDQRFPSPTIYVHTDLIRTRIYRRLGFKTIEVDRAATGLRDGEYIMEAPIEEVYRLLKAGLDRSKMQYDLNASVGNNDLAISEAKSAIELHPSSDFYSEGHQHLAELLMDRGDMVGASSHARKAFDAKPYDPSVVGTFLKAARLEIGAYAPQSRDGQLAEQMRVRWNSIVEEVATKLGAAKLPPYAGQVGIRRAYLDPSAALSYHKMQFDFAMGDLSNAIQQRSKFLELTGSAHDTLGWALTSTAGRDGVFQFFSKLGARVSPKYHLETWIPGEARKFKVESVQPEVDYMFLQMLAGRSPGAAATADFHEAAAQLAHQAGYKETAEHHHKFRQMILLADRKLQPSPY